MQSGLDKFRTDAVVTASPAKLLTMLYDRMILDLDRGVRALQNGDRAGANLQITHAQDIIAELIATLDVNAWSGGPGLLSLYTFCLRELVGANVSGDAVRVQAVRELLDPLRQAWHEAAALQVEAIAAAAPVPVTSSGELGVG